MAGQDQLLEELKAVLAEIETLEEKIAASTSPDDRMALEHGLKQLVERKVALEEEINQATGASRWRNKTESSTGAATWYLWLPNPSAGMIWRQESIQFSISCKSFSFQTSCNFRGKCVRKTLHVDPGNGLSCEYPDCRHFEIGFIRADYDHRHWYARRCAASCCPRKGIGGARTFGKTGQLCGVCGAERRARI